MLLLIVGASGLLGSNVATVAHDRGYDVVGTYLTTKPTLPIPVEKLDLRDESSAVDLLEKHDPDTVLNCAGMTDVDQCEAHPEDARRINSAGPAHLAAACDERNIDFVQISTDYVFDGTARKPYTEDAVMNPKQVYGESKAAGERAVRENHTTPLIVRLSFVYGTHAATRELVGFPAWVRDQLTENERVPLFTDQFVTPSRAGSSGRTILELLEADATGVVHVASRSCVTLHEFGNQVRKRTCQPASLIERCSMESVDRSATRPKYSCLDVSRVEAVLERDQPTLKEDLDSLDGMFG